MLGYAYSPRVLLHDPPPPTIELAGRDLTLGTAGVLLGAVPNRSYTEHGFTLRPKDTVLLYTDGVTDTPGAVDRFGSERLAELFEHAPEAPAEILQRIEETLKHFQHGTTIDDRAMLVLRYTGAHALEQAA